MTKKLVATPELPYTTLLRQLGMVVKQAEEGKAIARQMQSALPEGTPISQQGAQIAQLFESVKEQVTYIWGAVMAAQQRSQKPETE